jgi:hypothetical protein
MTRRWQAFVLIMAVLFAAALTSGAAFLSVASVGQPATGVLGAEWKCRNMMLFTSCTRVRHAEPTAQRVGRDAIRAERV